MPNPVVFFEVLGKDKSALRRFYGDLFEDWQINEGMENYFLVNPGEGTLQGGLGSDPAGHANHVTFYVQVDDIDAALGKAQSLGGQSVMPATNVMEGVTIALFTDPEGHLIGLYQAPPA